MTVPGLPGPMQQRRAGLLLHPTALDEGRGALGARARAFVDWLAAAGFSVWQVLPLSPTGRDGSPYWTRSDLAGSVPLLDRDELPDVQAHGHDYQSFLAAQGHWLEDYVLYEALAERFGGVAWWEWPAPCRDRDPETLQRARAQLHSTLEARRVQQWQFDRQWQALRAYAAERGVLLFGDIPMYVAPDSVSTWAQREQFQLGADGRPTAVAGVPPDYFAADGQLWGNPLYRWEQAERDGFAFWRSRIRRQLERFDLLRIDHFRGLAAHWAVPAGAATAREGRWIASPGHALLRALIADLPQLPLVAEDLGVITHDVEELRDAFSLPGMRVLQFGFGDDSGNPHLPHNYIPALVAYTGTHDNDTTLGWYRNLEAHPRVRVDAYLGAGPDSGAGTDLMPHAAVRAVMASVARLAVVPMQDLLALGSEARFNTPGTVTGNWRWRLPPALSPALAARCRALHDTYGRCPSPRR
jgi:4-alpha-glucanotransferase